MVRSADVQREVPRFDSGQAPKSKIEIMFHDFGIVLGWFWDGFGMVLGWFWDGFGMVLAWFGDDLGMVLGWFWDDFGMILCAGARCRRPCIA